MALKQPLDEFLFVFRYVKLVVLLLFGSLVISFTTPEREREARKSTSQRLVPHHPQGTSAALSPTW
jgi:hypothetical protein